MNHLQRQQQQQAQQSKGVRAAKTKKFQLDTKTYIWMALKGVLLKFWWAFLIPVAIMLIAVPFPQAFGWCLGIAITLNVLWIVFWVIQFTGITQMEQYKFLFEKVNYEISTQHILIKLNAKQGMPVTWNQIQSAKKGKDHYYFSLSLAQFIYLPFEIFKSENDMKFVDTILKRKNLLAVAEKEEKSPTA
ncbi:MAG: hypothetical protein ACI85I_001910 [Arenicella sp.]|jgi:hypothetical protein